MCRVLDAFYLYWDGEPLPPLVGTQSSAALSERRALMAADWLVRTHTPTWLRLAGLDASADALSALPEITSVEQIPLVRVPVEMVWENLPVSSIAAKDEAAANNASAAAAFGTTGGYAAAVAAWSDPCVTARTRAESRVGVWDKVGVIGQSAASRAIDAGTSLSETCNMLQRSAVELAGRMISCAL